MKGGAPAPFPLYIRRPKGKVKMKYPYLVIHNGIEYPIGQDVPNDNTNTQTNTQAVVETVETTVNEESVKKRGRKKA